MSANVCFMEKVKQYTLIFWQLRSDHAAETGFTTIICSCQSGKINFSKRMFKDYHGTN